jgi:hypothetical protein
MICNELVCVVMSCSCVVFRFVITYMYLVGINVVYADYSFSYVCSFFFFFLARIIAGCSCYDRMYKRKTSKVKLS